jgi:hypothetical protein
MDLVGTYRLFGAVSRRLVSVGSASALVSSVVVGSTLIGVTQSAATGPASTGCNAASAGTLDKTLVVGAGQIVQEAQFVELFAGERIIISTSIVSGGDATTTANWAGFAQATGPAPSFASYQFSAVGGANSQLPTAVWNNSSAVPVTVVFSVICLDSTNPLPPIGTIVIEKSTNSDTTFSFTGDLGAFDLTTVTGIASRTFSNVTAGTYSVTELASATHMLSGLVCDDPTSDTTTSGATATIDLAAGETVTCTYTNTEVGARTAAIIAGFMERRAGTLTEAGPTLQHFLDRFTGNAEAGFSSEILSYQEIPNGGGGAEFDAVMMDPGARWAFWLEGTFERYREGGPGTEINGGVAMLQGGFDVLLGDNLIVGVTAVGDGARELSTDLGYFVEGLGWMAGPYGAVRLAEGVVFDAKFLWGQSWNDISPFLTYTDQFTTTRWLATARLAGEAAIGPLMFRPEIYVAYFRETQAEYVDTNGITIPEQTIALGRLTFGPEIAIPVQLIGGGVIEPRIAMEGVWDFIGTRPISARVNGGLQFSTDRGATLLLSGGYGGLFAPSFSSWNVRANITVPLQ